MIKASLVGNPKDFSTDNGLVVTLAHRPIEVVRCVYCSWLHEQMQNQNLGIELLYVDPSE